MRGRRATADRAQGEHRRQRSRRHDAPDQGCRRQYARHRPRAARSRRRHGHRRSPRPDRGALFDDERAGSGRRAPARSESEKEMSTSSFRAFRIFEENGKIECRLTTLTLDDLTAGEVVIKAAYSNVNYKDALAGTGAGKIIRRFPLVGGIDVA